MFRLRLMLAAGDLAAGVRSHLRDATQRADPFRRSEVGGVDANHGFYKDIAFWNHRRLPPVV